MVRFYLLLVLLRAYSAKTCSVLHTNLGECVTLQCFYMSSANHLSWYKQAAGEHPQIISFYYKSLPGSNSFRNQFKGDPRFSVDPGEGFYHLNISNVKQSDSAMYYCGRTSVSVTEFNNCTFLVLKDSSRRFLLQQPPSHSVLTGDSVTLNCTVHTGAHSHEDHSIYWFRYDSGDSQLGTLYTHRNSSGQCVQRFEADSPSQSCVYSLAKRNVSLPDAGTYYCAVASCGDILFGKGTRLYVGEKQNGDTNTLPILMYGMFASLAVSVILNIILVCILYKMKIHLSSRGLQLQPIVSAYTADNQNEGSDALQYAALDFRQKGRTRRQTCMEEEETIYSALRRPDLG